MKSDEHSSIKVFKMQERGQDEVSAPKQCNCIITTRQRHIHHHPKVPLMWVLLVGLLVTSWLPVPVSGRLYLPPLFNAAKDKPISLEPQNATCGYEGRARKYCRSSTDPSTVTACIQNWCNTDCANTRALPHKEDAFSRVVAGWGSCVKQGASVDGPPHSSQPGGQVVEFKGDPGGSGGDPCYLDLDQSWMIQIKIKSTWSIAVTTWIKPNRTGASGTVLNIADLAQTDLLRIVVDADLRLQVALLNTNQQSYVRGMTSWQLPENAWTHLAIQVQDDWFSVHMNGSFVGPALYKIPYRPPNQAALYRLGRSFSGRDYFRGYMQDFRIYTDSVSNREIEEIYSESLPVTRIMTQCRCPAERPKLKPSDAFYCVANPGTDSPTSESFRLNKGASGEAFPIEYANDGKEDSAWLSFPGIPETTITVNLEQIVDVASVELVFYSPLPDLVTIERLRTTPPGWETWHYFAHDCKSRTGLSQDGAITQYDTVICQRMVKINTSPPSSEGVLTFDLLTGRPGYTSGSVSSTLRPFIQAAMVRVTLKDMPFVTNDDHKYHGLYEIKVNTRCECNGHGEDCDMKASPYQCMCAADSYTRGRQCEECVDDAFRPSGGGIHDACQLCDCHTDGTKGGDPSCDMDGGQCKCKDYVEGRRCDICKPGYSNLQASNREGCEPCLCHSSGTINGSVECDSQMQCSCKLYTEGKRCDRCKLGYFDLQGVNIDGCRECGCHNPGSQNNECDRSTGQCICKANTEGRACDRCKEGSYNLQSSNSDGCEPCGCDLEGSLNSSCDATTGQCYCKPHSTGRKCDECATGFYAQDQSEFTAKGCTIPCDCHLLGTLPNYNDTCEQFGGQCTCKGNVQGRRCDRCKSGSYGFGESEDMGCKNCWCNPAGSAGSASNCDDQTGNCDCKVNVMGKECDKCRPGTYGLSDSNSEGCQKCDCYSGGVDPTKVCDDVTGKCHCLPDAGDPVISGNTCKPYVKRFFPQYGPESGGTLLTFHGGFLGSIQPGSIKLADIPCDITESNHTHVKCLTRSLWKENRRVLKNMTLDVAIDFGQYSPSVDDTFMYLEDPTISNIQPLKTFLNGGLDLTVTGTFLTSVASPFMTVYVEHFGIHSNFSSLCVVNNATEMMCPTPLMQLPENTAQQSRKRRDLDTQIKDITAPSIRHKRDSSNGDDGMISGENTKFYLGFKLDGVQLYRNMSKVNDDIARLTVYRNPQFEMFIEKGREKIYRPYWPFSHSHIDIKGRYLDAAVHAKHYNITIGVSECADIDLSHNKLLCRPPTRQPDARPDASAPGSGAPEVWVYVGNIVVTVGYLKYEHNFWENLPFRYGVIGGIAGLLLLIFIILLIRMTCCKKKKKNEKAAQLEMRNSKHASYISAYYSTPDFSGGESDYLNPTMDLLDLLPRDLRIKVNDCLIDYKRMQLGKMVGQGQFGRVYIGKLNDEFFTNDITVAIKTLREFHVTPKDVIQFLEEATIMKDFRHEHVLHLLGVVVENNRAYVLLPYMTHGDLKTFISSEDNMLTVGDLINFGGQVCEGMVYLSEQKFVHRDLAARNCMVGSDLMVKIADFGLSRDIYESDYYKEGDNKKFLPVKWMALESLESGHFSSKSDVWSFGVVLWELMTRGCQPYPDVDPFDLKTYLALGNRMDKPDYAPEEVYTLMMWCWEAEAIRRPTFRQASQKLQEILAGQNVNTVMRNKRARIVHPHTRVGHNYLDMFV